MNALVWLWLGIFPFLAVLLGWLWVRHQSAQRRADLALRVRVLGDEADTVGFGAVPMVRNPLLRAVHGLLARSGIDLEPERVGQGLLMASALVPILLILMGPLAGLFTLFLAGLAVYAVLSRQAASRRAKLIEQLPAFLESAMRVLSAGNTLEESLAAAARESPDPIRPLFIGIGRQLRLGAPIETVLAEAADIHRIRDLRVVALAAAINRKYGGSLRQVMKSLIINIRQRDTAARELRALTAETRFSALVLSVIPVSLSFYIFLQNRSYYAGMWADGSGRWVLMLSVLLQVAGVIVLWRMMNNTGDGDE